MICSLKNYCIASHNTVIHDLIFFMKNFSFLQHFNLKPLQTTSVDRGKSQKTWGTSRSYAFSLMKKNKDQSVGIISHYENAPLPSSSQIANWLANSL